MTEQDIISRLERIESLLLQLTSKKENTAPFLPFMEQAVEEAAVSEGTRENHRNTLRHLRDFRPAMTFADLSPRLVADFEGYLHDLGLKLNTVAKQMKVFRRYVNVAIDEELITSDPFRKWHVRTEPTSKQALTERQLRKWEQSLSDSTLSDEELLVSRAFLFSCYTWLRYSDDREAHFNHIHTTTMQSTHTKAQETGIGFQALSTDTLSWLLNIQSIMRDTLRAPYPLTCRFQLPVRLVPCSLNLPYLRCLRTPVCSSLVSINGCCWHIDGSGGSVAYFQ